jgi:hypothetical protein
MVTTSCCRRWVTAVEGADGVALATLQRLHGMRTVGSHGKRSSS